MLSAGARAQTLRRHVPRSGVTGFTIASRSLTEGAQFPNPQTCAEYGEGAGRCRSREGPPGRIDRLLPQRLPALAYLTTAGFS
jgi:hypothetical protein